MHTFCLEGPNTEKNDSFFPPKKSTIFLICYRRNWHSHPLPDAVHGHSGRRRLLHRNEGGFGRRNDDDHRFRHSSKRFPNFFSSSFEPLRLLYFSLIFGLGLVNEEKITLFCWIQTENSCRKIQAWKYVKVWWKLLNSKKIDGNRKVNTLGCLSKIRRKLVIESNRYLPIPI